MTTPVTDPEILKQLNAPDATASASTPVTDPHILAQLNADDRGTGAAVTGYGKAVLGGVNEGIAHTVGLPVDLYNLVGDTTMGRGPSWLADKAGMPAVSRWIDEHGYKPIYTGSGQSMVDAEKRLGIGYDPVTPGEQSTKDVVSGGTTAGLAALLTGGLSDAASIGNQAIAGAGGVVGGKLANAVNSATGDHVPKPVAELIGAIFGGFGTSGLANRTWKYEPTELTDDFEKAGVSPHFASDVNPQPGLLGRALSNSLPNRFGAQAISERNAQATQSQLGNYVRNGLEDADSDLPATMQGQGTHFQKLAQDAVDALKAQTKSAYEDVDAQIAKLPASPLSGQAAIDASAAEKAAAADLAHAEAVGVPGSLQSNRIIQGLRDKWEQAKAQTNATTNGSTVATTNTANAISDLVNRASDPDVKTLVQTPTFNRFAEIAKKPSLSWNDMNVLRTEVGQSIQGADGSELGLLKQIYKGINDDMRVTAAQNPASLDAFNKASEIAKNNNDQIRELTKRVINAPSPETLPGYMTQQAGKGSTRLDSLFNTLGDMSSNPNLKGELGKSLLQTKAAASDGSFDLDQLMKFFRTASPEAKQALTNDPSVADMMNRASRLYDATSRSRDLAGKPIGGAMDDLGGLGLAGLGAGTAGLGHALQGGSPILGGIGAAAGAAAYPGAMRTAAGIAQSPGLVSRFASPVTGNMITTGQKLQGSGAAAEVLMFPDVYQPNFDEKRSALPSGADLATANKPAVVSHIASTLGPRIASQVPSDDPGYAAALFSLAANPAYRKALGGRTDPDQ